MTYKSSSSSGEPTELGMLGWGVAALQVVGFCAGGFIVYGMLVAVPYDASARLLRAGQLQPALNEFAALPNQSQFGAKALLNNGSAQMPHMRKPPDQTHRTEKEREKLHQGG
jgi:hypothetical protein